MFSDPHNVGQGDPSSLISPGKGPNPFLELSDITDERLKGEKDAEWEVHLRFEEPTCLWHKDFLAFFFLWLNCHIQLCISTDILRLKKPQYQDLFVSVCVSLLSLVLCKNRVKQNHISKKVHLYWTEHVLRLRFKYFEFPCNGSVASRQGVI